MSNDWSNMCIKKELLIDLVNSQQFYYVTVLYRFKGPQLHAGYSSVMFLVRFTCFRILRLSEFLLQPEILDDL